MSSQASSQTSTRPSTPTSSSPSTPTQRNLTGKKQHINDMGSPSRVVHCRNVTSDVTQSSLFKFCRTYGPIKQMVMLRAKNQALVEMESLPAATEIVEGAQPSGYSEVDGRRVFMKFSRHQEIDDAPAGKILLASMFHPAFDLRQVMSVSPLLVFQIFGSFAEVEKIVILPKNASCEQNHHRVQSLVQFATQEEAKEVKDLLQGQQVTVAGQLQFHLDLQFSKVTEVTTALHAANSLAVPRGMTPQILQQQLAVQSVRLAPLGLGRAAAGMPPLMPQIQFGNAAVTSPVLENLLGFGGLGGLLPGMGMGVGAAGLGSGLGQLPQCGFGGLGGVGSFDAFNGAAGLGMCDTSDEYSDYC